MMYITIKDCIPTNQPHCGNCTYWFDTGELFGLCDKTKEYCPSFGVCDYWTER